MDLTQWSAGILVRQLGRSSIVPVLTHVCLCASYKHVRAHATRRRRAENEQNPGPFPLFSALLGTLWLALLSLTYSREHGASNSQGLGLKNRKAQSDLSEQD